MLRLFQTCPVHKSVTMEAAQRRCSRCNGALQLIRTIGNEAPPINPEHVLSVMKEHHKMMVFVWLVSAAMFGWGAMAFFDTDCLQSWYLCDIDFLSVIFTILAAYSVSSVLSSVSQLSKQVSPEELREYNRNLQRWNHGAICTSCGFEEVD